MTPLDIFEKRWSGDGGSNVAQVTIPYVGVVNLNVDLNAMPAKWGAAVHQPESTDDLTMGSNPWVVERGVFVIGLFAKSGTGPKVLDADVAQVKTAFHGWQSDGLRIIKVEGPLDIDPEADGVWWRLALTAQYEYTYRRDASGRGYNTQQGLLP